MTRALFVTCAVVGAVAVVGAQRGAGGQGGGRPTTPTPTFVRNTYDPNKTQTISGCLRPASTNRQFLVTDATVVKGSNSAVGTSGTAKKSYTGVIPPGLKLQTQVNHRVELAGTILDNGMFEMESLKMISATCP